MDSSRLEHLLKVIECGSITKASEELGYTQSGISHMVKALEKEFGFPLFARGRSGVEPTEDCKRIIPAIRQIVRWNEQLGQLTADIRGLTVGTVRVGTFTSVSVHWLPKILKRFQTQHPQVKIDLVEGGDQSLAHGLENGLVDVAFGRRPETLAADWVPLFPDQLMAVLPLGAWSGQSFPIAQFHKAPSSPCRNTSIRRSSRFSETRISSRRSDFPPPTTIPLSPWWNRGWGTASSRSWFCRATGTAAFRRFLLIRRSPASWGWRSCPWKTHLPP